MELLGRVFLGETEADFLEELELEAGDIFFADHPTGVAGTLASSGTNFPERRGMASGVTMLSFHKLHDYAEMGEAAYDGMLLSNHSYGTFAGWEGETTKWRGPHNLAGEDPEFGSYTEGTKTLDALAYLAPHYLSVWASGYEVTDDGAVGTDLYTFVDSNGDGEFDEISTLAHPQESETPLPGATELPLLEGGEYIYVQGPGFDTIVSTGSAKNNLTIGNIRDVTGSVNQSADLAISKSSSRGPSDDGRIKPDLVADGESILTLGSENANSTSFGSSNGTSYSAPGVTGTLALLQELLSKFGGPVLLSSTWKALLCNTAIDGTILPIRLGRSRAWAITLQTPRPARQTKIVS